MGLTFKEDVPDLRNSKVIDIVRELAAFGLSVQIHDPLASPRDAKREFGLELVDENDLKPADAVVLAVPHKTYRERGWPLVETLLQDRKGLVLDVRGALPRHLQPENLELWRM